MSRTRILLSCAIACICAPAFGQLTTSYVPIVFATTSTRVRTAGRPLPLATYWIGSIQAFNATPDPADAGIVNRFPGSCRTPLQPVAPQSAIFDFGDCGFPTGSVGFVEVATSPGVILSAQIGRADALSTICYRVLHPSARQGLAPLPIFASLFPPNAVTIAGSIDLGSPDPCTISVGEAYPRRVNATLFNAGSDPATFAVTVVVPGSQTLLGQEQYVVAAQDVQQFRLPIPPLQSTQLDLDVTAWVSITSTQPFLSYVSSIFDDGE